MSLLKFEHNNQLWGIVRNQKCASTSVLSYIAQALWSADPQEVQSYNSFKTQAPHVYKKFSYFNEYSQQLKDCDVRIAVWRDPIDKFISGFYHTMFSPSKAQDSLWIGSHTLNEFLINYHHYMDNKTVRDHCETNTARLGKEKSFYTHVFEYSESYKIADMLQAQHVNLRQTEQKPQLTKIQTTFVKYIMQEDYINGWCQ